MAVKMIKMTIEWQTILRLTQNTTLDSHKMDGLTQFKAVFQDYLSFFLNSDGDNDNDNDRNDDSTKSNDGLNLNSEFRCLKILTPKILI